MATFFGHGNPLSTTVGQLIEKATDGTQPSENWALFMEVCDVINETDEGPKDAIKAIRKRLQQNAGKNSTAVMYTLTQLETCVKNCGQRFHVHVLNKDFLHELIKIIGPKNDPPQIVQEKILSLIQTWAEAFKGLPEYKEVEKVYTELKTKGIEFPMTDLDHMAPIHTPARSVPGTEAQNRPSPQHRVVSGGPMVPPGGMPVQGTVTPTTEQQGKLQRDLELVSGNVRVMSEMLTELNPNSVDTSDLELLQELNRTCRQMQSRIVDLLSHVGTEEVTNELLRVNDDLNNVFLRYERFERYRTGQVGTPDQAPVSHPVPSTDHLPPSYDQVVSSTDDGGMLEASSNPNVGNLIDLGEDQNALTNVAAQFADLNVGAVNNTLGTTDATRNAAPPPRQDEEFDMFAQSRQSFDQNRKAAGEGTYTNQQEDQVNAALGTAVNTRAQGETLKLQDKETDYDEMEAWLSSQKKKTEAGGETVSSSEFDKFLAERAAAAEELTTIPAATGPQPPRTQRSNRQMGKDEEENPLFAL
ncbi:target of Myb protein 1-like isoform X2 [Gigantopelta aegis]|uniref:target of Myb protein 1-like isoform X2 n=1 Tax=Gigantopelta aegis TaxID=1735272 RepID=UPI001B88E0D6|nr:target of Myb protein 1-like isoform X2 [Gigantopelta aegis]